MTFVIVRRGVVIAHAQHGTLEDLADWLGAHRRPGDRLALVADAGVRVGERVEVREVTVGLATRPAVLGGAP